MRPNTRRHAEHGFTMPEILIALIVIALVSAILVPTAITIQKNNRDRETAQTVRTVGNALKDMSIQHPRTDTYSIASENDGETLIVYLDLNKSTTLDPDEPYRRITKPESMRIALEKSVGTFTVFGWDAKGMHNTSNTNAVKWSRTDNKISDEGNETTAAGY